MYSTKDLKDFIDISGYNRNPIVLESVLLGMGYTKVKIDLLLKYFDLIKNSTILHPIAYDFYINRKTYKELQEKYQKNKSQIANTIKRSTNKFFNILGEDLYDAIKKETNTRKLNYYDHFLTDLKVEYSMEKDNQLLGQLAINLDEFFPPKIEERPNITEDDIIRIAKRFDILSKPNLELIISNLNREHLGYIKYLLETPTDKLGDLDIEYKELLKKRLYLK